MAIQYPKQTKVIKAPSKKNTAQTKSAELENIKLQIDELATKNQQTELATTEFADATQQIEEISSQVASNTTAIGTIQNAVGTNTQNISTLQSTKQNILTAGDNITIQNNTISATDTIYTAGNNITIDANNQISATNTTYTAGTGIDITNGVISATSSAGLSSVTASNVDSELATQGQVLTANGQGGATWQTASGGGGLTQEQETKLNDAYNYYISHIVEPDPYYSGLTPSEYPAGTIYKTYDEDIKRFNLQNSSSVNLPYTFFLAETGSSGTIRIEEKFKVLTTLSNVQIIIKLNDATIYSDVFIVDAINNENTFYREFTGLNFNQNAKGNKINITLNLQQASGTKTLVCTKQRIEIIGSNPEILTKICPFAVDSYNDRYYFSDCSNGTAKIANIKGTDLNNINNLIWTDTEVYAQYYRQVPMFDSYGSNYIVKEIANYQISYEGNNYVNTPSSSWTANITGLQIDYVHMGSSNGVNFIVCENLNQRIKTFRANMLSSNYTAGSGVVFNSVILSGVRALYTLDNKVPNVRLFTYIDENGNAYFKNTITANSGTNYLSLGSATYVNLYLTSFTSQNNYAFDIYLKRNGTFYKYSYTYNGSYTLNSSTEIGVYDYFFALPNNDYWVVKNGILSYHKLPNQ